MSGYCDSMRGLPISMRVTVSTMRGLAVPIRGFPTSMRESP